MLFASTNTMKYFEMKINFPEKIIKKIGKPFFAILENYKFTWS